MSMSKLDRSGVFGSSKLQLEKTEVALAADAIQFSPNGIEFRCTQAFPAWAEMTVDLQSPIDGKPIHFTGVVVACHGNRHLGYVISMVFLNVSRQARERLSELSATQALL